MEKYLKLILHYILQFREIASSYLGPALPWLTLVSVIISGILLWLIFYAISGSSYVNHKIEKYMDRHLIGDVGKRRQLRVWKRILKAVKGADSTNWKRAILEADAILDEVIKMTGYRGQTVHDRFKQLPPESITNYEQIIEAHRIRDRVRQEPDFVLTQEETTKVIKIYEQTFKELGLIE